MHGSGALGWRGAEGGKPLAPLSSEPGVFLPPLPLPPPSHCVSWAPLPPAGPTSQGQASCVQGEAVARSLFLTTVLGLVHLPHRSPLKGAVQWCPRRAVWPSPPPVSGVSAPHGALHPSAGRPPPGPWATAGRCAASKFLLWHFPRGPCGRGPRLAPLTRHTSHGLLHARRPCARVLGTGRALGTARPAGLGRGDDPETSARP